jgi:cell shape-determining protein MreD
MRRAILSAIPVLGLVMMLQISIASRIMLLSGNVDLLLLVVAAWGLQERVRAAWIWGLVASLLAGLVSGVPWYIYLIGYLSVVGVARIMVHRIWQAPLLAMFAVTFIGTLELLMLTFVQRTIFEVPLGFSDVFSQIILPTVLLNLLLAIPVHSLIRDLAKWLYPEDVLA